MLLAELLEVPALGLRVLHAPAGALRRPVGRPVTTDLLHPGRYLTGGEVVLTGLVWRRSPEDSERFVASIAERGATTLLAGTALLGDVPDDLTEACRRHDVALIEVPTEVPFADITEHLAATGASAQLTTSLIRHRSLLSAIASGSSLDELVERVSREIGHVCRVLTATGRHVVPGPGELDPTILDTLCQRFLTAVGLPTVVRAADAAYSLFPVGSTIASRLTAWVLVVEGDVSQWARDDVDALHELCAIVALDRSRRDEGLRATRPLAADLLGLVEAGAPHAEIAGRVRQAGLDPTRPLVVAVAEVVDAGPSEPGSTGGLTVTLLEDLALAFGPPVVAASDGRAVAFLPAADDTPAQVRSALARLAPGLHRASLLVGVSGETAVEALAGALEEARFAHRAAQAGGGRVAVVGPDQVTSHVLLLAAVPDDVRRTYAQRVLGKVLEQDQRGRSDLIGTLQEFLARSGSWSRTAESLHLHVNTVRYRIERIQELTGRDLSRLEDRVDVFLALKSL